MNRIYLECSGGVISISENLAKIEKMLYVSSKIMEVHIVANFCIHFNANLRQEIWHGKNLVVYTKNLLIKDNIEINLSGNDGENKQEITEDSESLGDDSKDGEDGNCGESGGNVLLCASLINKVENLCIITNGGNGSKGQNGKKGRDGINGKGIEKNDMLKQFPTWASTIGIFAGKYLMTTIENIEKKTKKKSYKRLQSYYVNEELDSGEIIIFSKGPSNTLPRYTYFLYKGSSGQCGKKGGKFGYGGQGGFEGNVEILSGINTFVENKHILIVTKAGNVGESGRGGKSGKPGLDGWDMGYSDRMLSTKNVYGEDKKTKLNIKLNSSSSDSVWCYENQCYCSICPCGNIDDVQKNFIQTRNNSLKQTRDKCSIAEKKKYISRESITELYESKLKCSFFSNMHEIAEVISHNSTMIQNLVDQQLNVETIVVKELQITQNIEKSLLRKKAVNKRPYQKAAALLLTKEIIDNDKINAMNIFEVRKFLHDCILPVNMQDKVRLLQEFKISSRQIQDKEFLKNVNLQYALVIKKKKIIETKAELLKNPFFIVETSEKNENEKIKYLVPEENIDKLTVLQYFTDNIYERERCAETLVTFLKELSNTVFLHAFLEKFVLENDKDKFQIIEHISHNLENLASQSEYQQEKLNIEHTSKNKTCMSYKSLTWNKFLATLKESKSQFWKNCDEQDIIFKQIFVTFKEKGYQLSCYRDLVSQVESIPFHYVELENNTEVISTFHTFDSAELGKSTYIIKSYQQYEIMKIDYAYLELDVIRDKSCAMFDRIIMDIYSLNTESDIQKYRIPKTIDIKKLEEDKNNSTKNENLYIKFLENVFRENNFNEISLKIEKISRKYNFPNNLFLLSLHNLLQIDALTIPMDIFSIIINEIIEAFNKDISTLNMFSYIVLTTEQNDWIFEILYLCIENCCRCSLLPEKTKIIEQLKNIKKLNIQIFLYTKLKLETFSVENLPNILYVIKMLGSLTDFDVTQLNIIMILDWKYILANEYYRAKLKNIYLKYSEDDIVTDIYYVSKLCNLYGETKIDKLLEVLLMVTDIKQSKDISLILQKLANGELGIEECIRNITESRSIEKVNQELAKKNIQNIQNICNLIKSNANNSNSIKHHLDIVMQIVNRTENWETTLKYIALSQMSTQDITKCIINQYKSFIDMGENEIIYEILLLLDRAVELTRGFKLRYTQKAAIILLFKNENHALAEVSTGEGKSLIVVALAILNALQGRKVDIITSSSLLAIRDSVSEPPKGYKDLYEIFNVSVSHNCFDDIEKRKKVYAENNVIYGQISNFQRDCLLDTFYNKNILGDRKHDVVIIDEVDSMLLDNGNNTLYLSRDLPGFNWLESVYVFIWQLITSTNDDLRKTDVRATVVNAIFNPININDLQLVDSILTGDDLTIIWRDLMISCVINKRGTLLLKHAGEINNVNFLSEKYKKYKNCIIYLIEQHLTTKPKLLVPIYLHDFILQHLDTWIENAMIALLMQQEHDYVVDVDRSRLHHDRFPIITILDRDTGTDLRSSQWDEALHQFLQIKHGCRLTLQTLKSVFVSNITYFKKYEKIFGLTGTLGSKVEREILKEMHTIDFATIPTAKPKVFVECPAIVCDSQELWLNKLLFTTKQRLVNKQSVLLIFDTIKDLETVATLFKKHDICSDIKIYQRDYEEFQLTQGKESLCPGVVILATNLAGRGSDIKLSKDLVKAGGLHVCLTYLPRNSRIEQQAFGRAARCGEPGSGQLIILLSDDSNANSIAKLKTERDIDESLRLSGIKCHYQNQILKEENYLNKFTLEYKKKQLILNDLNVYDDIKEVLMNSCINKWSFWLDLNCREIKTKKLKEIDVQFNTFISQIKELKYYGPTSVLKNTSNFEKKNFLENTVDTSRIKRLFNRNTKNWKEWIDDPCNKVKLAKILFSRKYFDAALVLLKTVLEEEPECGVVAQYYLSAIYLSLIDWSKRLFDSNNDIYFEDSRDQKLYILLVESLQKSMQGIEELIQNGYQICSILDVIKNSYSQILQPIVEVNALEKQKENQFQLYGLLTNSIHDMLGHQLSPESFILSDLNIFACQKVFDDLQDCFNLATRNPNYSEKELDIIAKENYVNSASLKIFIDSLKDSFDFKTFKANIKKALQPPSREVFFNELLKNKILFYLEEFVLIDFEKLKLVDPSLEEVLQTKLINKELQKVDFNDFKTPIIFKYPIECDGNAKFTKLKFIEFAGLKRYEYLIKNHVISLNQKAELDLTHYANSIFSAYHILSPEDFITNTISYKTAEYIIDSLCKVNIVCKEKDLSFKLVNNNMSLLPQDLKIYELHIFRVLHLKFIYKIKMELIKQQVNNKDFPIKLGIESDPCNTILYDLISKNIIVPPKLVIKENKLKEKIETKYKENISFEELKNGLLEIGVVCNETEATDLVQDLLKNKWIQNNTFLQQNIKTASKCSLHKNGMEINIEHFRSIKISNLDEIYKLSENYTFIALTVKSYLKNKQLLATKNIKEHIFSVLSSTKSKLHSLEHPSASLQSIEDFKLGGEFIMDLEVLKIISFEHTIVTSEEKYTSKMIRNALAVIGIGITQCLLGLAVTYFSAGILTHLGSALINEGIGDIIYGSFCFKSGHFNWSDYRKHKLQSLAMSAVCGCVAAYSSYGTILNRYFHEVAGSGNFNITASTLLKAGGKLILGKLAKSFVMPIFSSIVDYALKNTLNNLCKNLSSKILGSIGKSIQTHENKTIIEELITTSGADAAQHQVKTAISNEFSKQLLWQQFGKLIINFCTAASSGISEAMKKIGRETGNCSTTIKVVSNITIWSIKIMEIINNVVKIYQIKDNANYITNNIMENLKIKKNEQITKNSYTSENNDAKEELVYKLLDKVEEAILNKASNIIDENLVTPLVTYGTNLAAQYTIHGIKETYKGIRNSMHRRQFKKIKDGFTAEINNANPDQVDNIKKQYNKNLTELMKKCRSPELFADIIREGVPMDSTCVQASLHVICKMLDIKNLSVEIKNANGESQMFTVGSTNDAETVNLSVDGNHFDGGEIPGDNNCLFAALVKQIPELNSLTADEFRDKIADKIVSDSETRERIEQGWSGFAIQHGMIGGYKAKNLLHSADIKVEIKDEKLESTIDKLFLESTSPKEMQNCFAEFGAIMKSNRYEFQNIEDGKVIVNRNGEIVSIFNNEKRNLIKLNEKILNFESSEDSIKGKSIVYLKYCVITGKTYTGQSIDGETRKQKHIRDVDSLFGNCKQIKYAREQFLNNIEQASIPEDDKKFLSNRVNYKTNKTEYNALLAKHNIENPSNIYNFVPLYVMDEQLDKTSSNYKYDKERHQKILVTIENGFCYILKSELSQRTPRVKDYNQTKSSKL